jgi:hypothetical protein
MSFSILLVQGRRRLGDAWLPTIIRHLHSPCACYSIFCGRQHCRHKSVASHAMAWQCVAANQADP